MRRKANEFIGECILEARQYGERDDECCGPDGDAAGCDKCDQRDESAIGTCARYRIGAYGSYGVIARSSRGQIPKCNEA